MNGYIMSRYRVTNLGTANTHVFDIILLDTSTDTMSE